MKIFNELVTITEAINKDAQHTRGREKVLGMKDVADFKAYARNRIEVLELLSRQGELTKELYSIFKQEAEDHVAGRSIDEAAVTSKVNRYRIISVTTRPGLNPSTRKQSSWTIS